MSERQGYFDRRMPSSGEKSSQAPTDDARVEEALLPTSDVLAATTKTSSPEPVTPPKRASTSPQETAADLERQARLLEQAAVDAATAARQAGRMADDPRGTEGGRGEVSRRGETAKVPVKGTDLDDLRRKAERLYGEALRARLRADHAAQQAAPGGPPVPIEPHDGPDPSEGMRVVTWNRPELDWTTLVAAAIDEGDETADPDTPISPRRPEGVASPVALGD